MNTDKHPEPSPSEGDGMDSSDVKSHEDEEKNSQTENGLEHTEEDPREMKSEVMEVDGAGGGSEDDDEDQVDEEEEEEEEEEEDEEEEEETETLNEPQDLSLVDDSRYNGAALQDAGGAAAAEAPCVEPTGKLNCDVCGLNCISVNVLLVHRRSHTGERPFHCSQCGASFTQKGNLLRHVKLHSGEKPFKCPKCSYACRRRDALSGHLRTHSVEKPFKCKNCSRSYKQRSSLEEHRDRCQAYIQNQVHVQNQSPDQRADDLHPTRTRMGSDRAKLLDRLASNVARRKNSVPQKFTGDGVCLDLSFNQRSEVRDPPPDPPPPHGFRQQQGPDGTEPPPSHRPYPIQLNHKPAPPPPGLAPPPPVTYSLGHLLNHPQPLPPAPLEAVPGAVYPCGHCRVVFLDYVMFTIHMGCHGYRDPLQCNVCGHRSRDRYEFSSHIVRGEHRLNLT